jgi:hypothetical protein
MLRSPARLIAAIAVAATGIYLGVSLTRYADADDSPGGMLFGMLLVLGSLALAIRIALHRTRKPSPMKGE